MAYKVRTPTNALFIELDKVLKFTLKITLTCYYMFRSLNAVVWQHDTLPHHRITYNDVVFFLPNINLNRTLARLPDDGHI